MSLCLLNAQSVRNKTADFVDYICENKYDLVAITETWLQKRDNAVRGELRPTGYQLITILAREGAEGPYDYSSVSA